MRFGCAVLLSPFILLLTCQSTTSDVWSKFDYASASSVAIKLSDEINGDYSARSLLRRGSSFWASAGGHEADDVVSVLLASKKPQLLHGLVISWKFKPGEFRVSSIDPRNNTQSVLDWRSPTLTDQEGLEVTDDASDEISYVFDESVFTDEILLEMRKPQSKNFGIYFVAGLSSGIPLFQIVPGVTSLDAEDEYCLQSRFGSQPRANTDLILGSCLEAIAAGDGRDLFTFHPDYPTLMVHAYSGYAVQLDNNDVTGGGRLILVPLENVVDLKDGRASFIPQPSSEIKLARGSEDEDWCLSFNGGSPLPRNLALNSPVTCTMSSTDSLHDTSKAVDGDSSTYWTSDTMTLETGISPAPVNITLDLGDIVSPVSVKVLWEYPALSFQLMGAVNATDHPMALYSINGNSYLTSEVQLDALARFRYLT
eukprot:Blabericola_migrator_1__5528@NODE_281_length_10429_cov_52_996912_g231_i0_p2_GENE_NODE_281_length_10429_cov_52_996912_g231_i0NODE_281_length_10429_cov_52_996912_g231_i0_p2_ORF_typecomplete_len424_score65_16F5_F8_type_C/PF00754_25/2_4e02F5_F8_type_C/PF00754_25/0_0021ANAPC10/PF03256_16/0_055_NODE_281_length_10429_cov_52_996912_g231_i029274198